MALAACGDEVAEESNPAIACVSPEVTSTLGDIVFEAVSDAVSGDTSEIEDLRDEAEVSLEMAVLDKVDQDNGRTDCSARFVVAIPEDFQDMFDGEEQVSADFSYSIQPAADGDGAVVEADESLVSVVETIANAFVDADAPAQAEKPAQKAAPAQATTKTYNPSFSCSGRLSFTEQAICEDPTLSRLDRQLAQVYREARSLAASPEARRQLANEQRAWVQERDACANNTGYECYVNTYESRIAYLSIQD